MKIHGNELNAVRRAFFQQRRSFYCNKQRCYWMDENGTMFVNTASPTNPHIYINPQEIKISAKEV